MKILVTGGAGYIGSHTCVELLREGYDVIVLDNFSNSSRDVIRRIEQLGNNKISLYEGDVLDRELLKKVFSENNIYGVVHFAGLKSVSESIRMPLRYYENNVQGSLNVLNEALVYNVDRFIFSSSATVYGEPEKNPLTEECLIGGTTNPYGTSKYFVERILEDVSKSSSLFNIMVLRYFNPVGAHPSGLIGEMPSGTPNNLVPYLTQVASGKREFLNIYGGDYLTVDGTGVRDFIHVVDLAKGHVAALRVKATKNYNVYNLGTGRGYSVLELIKVFEEVTGISLRYKIGERRPGDVAECWSDPSHAKKELCWEAEKTLHDMMRDAWLWEKNNAI